MQKNFLTLTVGVVTIISVSACTSGFAGNSNSRLDADAPVYGSADRTGNEIEMAGRSYPIHNMSGHRVEAARNFTPARQYALSDYNNTSYQPLSYYGGDTIAQGAVIPRQTARPAQSTASESTGTDSYIWY